MTELRWQQRFQNFEKAFILLHDLLDRDIADMSSLEQEGVVQRFEYTFELAWKTLKDYLEYTGIALEQITPRAVIKAAFSAKIIADGQIWIDMLRRRNLMSHIYEEEAFELTVKEILTNYIEAFQQLYVLLKEKSEEA